MPVQVRDTLSALSVERARKNRDAFVAAVYAQLFDWLVQRINTVGQSGGEGIDALRFIGVLDIFGFEIFQDNSFEQVPTPTPSPGARLEPPRHLVRLSTSDHPLISDQHLP